MDPKNFAIGILSTTGVILLVGLLIIATRPDPAWAAGMTATGGGYVLTVGRDATGDEDLLYMLHSQSARLIVYRFDSGRQQIDVVQGIDLAELSEPGTQPTQP